MRRQRLRGDGAIAALAPYDAVVQQYWGEAGGHLDGQSAIIMGNQRS